ncbi:MAG: TIR domain-containing protein, partial [Myxococcales bacterium]|nr:TIR domain-containing protein [Myxococcales bacterium]
MSTRDLIDVFVVFAGPDRGRAATLCRALHEAGLRVFSEHDLKAGDVWDTVLPARLRAARAVVILISEKWGSAGGRDESWYGPEEVALAIRAARKAESPPRLIPVLLDGALDCTPYGLLRVRAVQVTGDAFADAATEIAAVIDPTDADPPARKRDAVAVARERVENLRHGGASDATIRRAEAEVLTARRAARDGVAPREGEVFAERYLLIERLGDGGFATVWLAHDQRRGERVAVKVLHGRWRRDQSRIDRFERGAIRMASLTHDAVVRVLEKPSSHDGWHFYVMEHVAGGDLAAARTRAEAPLTAAEAITAVLTAA